MKKTLKVVDLFCGIGGLSLGFKNAGYDVVLGLDNWEEALDAYRQNVSPNALKADLSDVDKTAELVMHFKPDVIVGGPPCQDFSSSGKRDEGLGRGDLTVKFSEIIAKAKPRYFVMENVDRLTKTNKYKQAYRTFKNAGYGITAVLLNASYCGVPQTRKRYFILGVLEGKDDALKALLAKSLSKEPLTVRQYLNSRIDTEFYYRHPRNYSRRAIFSVDEPSPTIRGVNRPIPKGYSLRPNDATKKIAAVRPLTTYERALIQTFPENFRLKGSKTSAEQMIGNSVPPKLAQYVAERLSEYIALGDEAIKIGQVCLE